MEIVIKTTLSEILEKGDWLKFCSIAGYDEWCLNEGTARGDEVVTLTAKEAAACGMANTKLTAERPEI